MDKVIVAFEGEKTAQRFADIIESSYLARCLICHTADEVRRMVEKREIHVIVCGYKLHNWTAMDLSEDLPPTVLMLVAAGQSQLDLCDPSEVFPLPAPVSRADLSMAVRMALQMGRKLERLSRPRRSEEEKLLVDRAKTLLMDRDHLTEEEAHRQMQKRSMDAGTRMVQTAREMLRELEETSSAEE